MRKFTNKLYCFSPTVMVLTFLFEVCAAILAIFKYKINDTKGWLIIAILLALAGFQLAEFMVCGGLGLTGVAWARFGYVSITLLPALGLHLAHRIAGKKIDWLVLAAYISCAAFVAYYAFGVDTVTAGVCRANYSVFNIGIPAWVFAIYYYGWLLAALYLASRWISDIETISAQKSWLARLVERIFPRKDGLHDPKAVSGLKWLMVGYLSFILPTTIVNIIDPRTIEGIPSIMCGFAVILAVILLGFVAPRVLERKKK